MASTIVSIIIFVFDFMDPPVVLGKKIGLVTTVILIPRNCSIELTLHLWPVLATIVNIW